MTDALLGALIAVTATTALLTAIQLSESAFEKAGGSFLIEGNQSFRSDLDILAGAGYDTKLGAEPRKVLEDDLPLLPSELQ